MDTQIITGTVLETYYAVLWRNLKLHHGALYDSEGRAVSICLHCPAELASQGLAFHSLVCTKRMIDTSAPGGG